MNWFILGLLRALTCSMLLYREASRTQSQGSMRIDQSRQGDLF